MQTIEGISPDMIWTFLIVLVGLGGIVVLGDKVVDVFRKRKERKRIEKKEPEDRLAEEISKKVMEKLEPRFTEIDGKLANDKIRLDDYARKITLLEEQAGTQEAGTRALCRGMLALLNHALHNGNKDEIEEASKAFNEYLTGK